MSERVEIHPDMTYARARLWLGITSVGTHVVLAAVLLGLNMPSRLLADVLSGMATDALVVGLLLLGYLVVSLPFDLLGGYVLPHRFGREAPAFGQFFVSWGRGVVVQSAVMLAAALALLLGGRTMGQTGAGIVVALLMLTFVVLQEELARLAGRLAASRRMQNPVDADDRPVSVLAATDPGFTGGVCGLPGMESLVLPERWENVLTSEQYAVQVKRRIASITTGTRQRGLLLAVGFNMLGFFVCVSVLDVAMTTVADLWSFSLAFTLWSFAGLLILPTFSRLGVYEIDRKVRDQGVSDRDLEQTMRALDRLQDDEPQRSRGVETIFHPVPAVENRLQQLTSDKRTLGAYHAARMALPLSWMGLGLLGRAVHCNCGRPELWVMLPSD